MADLRGERICIATHNAGKRDELAALLAPYSVQVVSAGDLGLAVPLETGQTFAENALLKAHAAARATGLLSLADDSGICVDALAGQPGIHTADWAETPAGRDFGRAMRRLWEALEAINAPEPRRAQFRCTLALVSPVGWELTFDGAMQGRVVWPMRGDHGHGFDPVFQPEGFDRTFAEMSEDEKNRISHRAEAFAKLVAECFT